MKDEILQQHWLTYIDWWKTSVKDPENPPTEDAFWVWYAMEKMAEPQDS